MLAPKNTFSRSKDLNLTKLCLGKRMRAQIHFKMKLHWGEINKNRNKLSPVSLSQARSVSARGRT